MVGAGTGATSATLGRHIRYHGLPTRLAVVDPENSAYFPGWATGAAGYTTGMPSRIEASAVPGWSPVSYHRSSICSCPFPMRRAVPAWTGLPVGGSTGTNLWGALDLIARMRAHGTHGLVVSLICDAADRHLRTYHDDTWTAGKGLSPTPFSAAIEQFLTHGRWQPPQPPPG